MPIKYCIFDVGQVCYPFTLSPLDDFCKARSRNFPELEKKDGVRSFNYNPFMRGEINFKQFCKELCAYCDIEYHSGLEVQIDEAMHQGVGTFYSETLEVMQILRNKNIGICLLSNALPNLEDTAVELAERDKIFVSYELGLLKPDIAIYQKVLQKLGVSPQEVIFIDDKVKNITAACELGIHGIVFEKNTIKKAVLELLK